jgi:NADP-dependent 3-hydroxy acid dehydrogenase YdfG
MIGELWSTAGRARTGISHSRSDDRFGKRRERETMNNIKGKVIAITGASSGIGEATAALLAERGAKIVAGARRIDRLQKLAAAISAKGGEIRVRAVDVTKRADVEAFIAFAKAEFGAVDVLVNNAGIMPLSLMAQLKTDEWDRMIDVNIRGVLNGIAAVLPDMKARGSGHVVNVASVAAHGVAPTAAVYCATKYAVWAISDGLRQESPELRVTIVSPGVVATELGNDISDATAKSFLVDLRKAALTPDAIARAIGYAVEQPDDVAINEVIVRPTGGTI